MRLIEVKTKTKEKTIDTEKMDAMLRDVGKRNKDKEMATSNKSVPSSRTKTSLKAAGKEKTQKAVSTAQMSPAAMHALASVVGANLPSNVSDEEALEDAGFDIEVPVVPENLPAIINKAIAQIHNKEPDWHQVRHLPGYISQPIRAMGEKVFSNFTSTKIKDIQVIASLGGQGPNKESDIDIVAKFLHTHKSAGKYSKMGFGDMIPGYEADAMVYDIADFTFMVVKDDFGKYVYAWPSKSTKKALHGKTNKKLAGSRKKLMKEMHEFMHNSMIVENM